jgi:preprotein translocase subunit SecF
MNIMKFRPLFFFISLSLILVSLFSIFKWNFRQGIDFAGGSNWEIILPNIKNKETVDKIFSSQNIKLVEVSQVDTRYFLKFENITQDQKVILASEFKKIDKDFREDKFETLGPVLGRELLQKTIYAIILSSLALLFFIGSRFKDLSFGVAAVLAMLHDAFVLIGSFSLLGHFFGAEIDTLFVTAILTTLSASVHDTVVTFDRIRELRRQSYQLSWVDLANRAVSEVIVRSINNSMTIIFMLFSLVLLGGDTTRWFAAALLIGVVCGTYSSTAVAIPLVLLFKKKDGRK